MNIERNVGRQRVGAWEFSPATGELRRRSEVRRLEPRAAKTLELLVEANGDVVSQEQLIAGVWSGRSLSDNSVAVVIGQLRRALDEDAREPKLIETIPKRGYRLRQTPAEDARSRRRKTGPVALLFLAAILVGAWLSSRSSDSETVSVAISDVVNDTGSPAYAPLARATSELIVTEMGARGFAVRRSGQGDLALASKLVIWDGDPYLGMTATDRTGEVRLSLMAKATTGKVPPAVRRAADALANEIPPNGGAARLAKQADGR